MALTDKLNAIAEAIRGKTGKTEEMTLDQMATEISSIETGGICSVQEYEIVTTSWNSASGGIPAPVALTESDNFVLYLISDTTDKGSLVGVLTQTNVGGRTVSTMHQLLNSNGYVSESKSVNSDGTRIINGTSASIGFPGGTWRLLVWR